MSPLKKRTSRQITSPAPAADEEAGNRLLLTDAFWRLAQRAFSGIVTDVVYWKDAAPNYREEPNTFFHYSFAFVGDPLKMAFLFGMLGDRKVDSGLPRRIGDAIRSAMNVPLTPTDMREMWSSEISLYSMLDQLGGRVAWQWADAHGPILSKRDEDNGIGISVTFIPEPGYPWPADGDRYWSAKQREWLPSTRPDWLVDVGSLGIAQSPYGVNPCAVFPPDETKTKPGGPVCGNLAGAPLMATHAMTLMDPHDDPERRHHKQIDMAIAGIRDCGGLLFPSLAVGPIPATNFGPIVLVAHLELVLASLLPYRKGQRRRPCWVYKTDAYTETMNTVLALSSTLFRELHGHSHWEHFNIYTLGVPASVHGGGGWHDPLTSTKQLASALKKRMRNWWDNMAPEEFEEANEDSTSDTKYAYTETKAREVVRLDEFPFLIAPTSMEKAVSRFVSGVGYKGKVVLDHYPDRGEGPAFDAYVWAWTVSDIVKSLRPVVEIAT